MTTNDSATTHWPHLTDDWDHRNHFLRTHFHPQAVMDAAPAAASRQSQDPSRANTLHITTPLGSIAAHARQDGWLQIDEVNLGSHQAWRSFWQRQKDAVEDHTGLEMMHLPQQEQEDTDLPDPDNEAREPWDHSLQWEVFEYALAPMRTTQYPQATTDPMSYRAFHVDTPGGAVTLWDDGNGWTSVIEVDLPPQEAQTFRTRVRDFLADHPAEHLRQD